MEQQTVGYLIMAGVLIFIGLNLALSLRKTDKELKPLGPVALATGIKIRKPKKVKKNDKQ